MKSSKAIGKYSNKIAVCVEVKRFTEITMLFLMICVTCGASIILPDNRPKSTISKENDSFNILQDLKRTLEYTEYLYDKQGYLTQALSHMDESL